MRYSTLLLILFSLACSKSEPATPPTGATPSEASTAPSEAPTTPDQAAATADEGAEEEQPSIALLAAGAEPRRALLRTSFQPLDTMKIRSEVTMTAQMGAEGDQKTVIPPIVHTLALKVYKMRPDGRGTVAFEVVGSEVLPAKEAKATVVEKMKAAAASIRGLKGKYGFDRQGVITAVEIAEPSQDMNRDPHMAESIGEFIYRSTVPVPSEPVGQGGKWTVKRRLKEGGILVDQTSTYELEKVDGSIIVVAVEIEKSAPNQKVGAPDPYDLEVFTAKGSGRLDVDLDRLAPQLATLKTETRLKMRAPGPSGTSVQSDITVHAEERISRP